MTPEEAAQGLYALLPRALAPEVLEDYGITATAEQACALTRELLSVNLYWIRAGITAHIPAKYQALIFERLRAMIERDWDAQFAQTHDSWSAYQADLDERFAAYHPIGLQPGGHIAVANEACTIAEERRLIQPDDRSNMLALLIDCVPLENYGELLDKE